MLQHFGHIELATDVSPPSARPPPEWATETGGSPRKPLEQCFPKSHLTLYANVCPMIYSCPGSLTLFTGRVVGSNEGRG